MPENDYFGYLDEPSGEGDYFSYLDQSATEPDYFDYLDQPAQRPLSAAMQGATLRAATPAESLPGIYAQAAESGALSLPALAARAAGGLTGAGVDLGKRILGHAPEFVQRVGNVALAPFDVAGEALSQYGREQAEGEAARQWALAGAAKQYGPVASGVLRATAYAPDAVPQAALGGLGLLGRALMRAGAKPLIEATARGVAEGVARNTVADVAEEIAERMPARVVTDLDPIGPATREMLRQPTAVERVVSATPGAVAEIAEVVSPELAIKVAAMKDAAIAENRSVASWLSPERLDSVQPVERELLKRDVGDRILAEVAPLHRVGREKIHGLEGRHRAGVFTRLARDTAARPEILTEYAGREVNDLVWEGIGVQGRNQQLSMRLAHDDYLRSAVEDASGHSLDSLKAERWLREHVDLDTASHGQMRVTRDEAAHLLAMTKDPDNRAAILKDGLWIKRVDTSTPVKLTVPQLDSFERSLAQSGEGRLAQSLFDRMPVVADEINRATGRVLGEEIATRPQYFHRARHSVEGDAPLRTFQDLRKQVLDSMGFLKERTGGDAPIVLRNLTDDFMEHVDNSSRFAAYLEPVTSATEVLGRADVAEALKATLGDDGFNRIMDAIDLQTIPVRSGIQGDSKVRALMRNVGAGILGMRLGPVLLNPAGLFVSAAYQERGFRHLAESLASGSIRRVREVNQIAKKFSPAWRDRYEHSFSHQVTSGMFDSSRRRFGPRTLTEFSLAPLEFSDRVGATVRWDMAERHIAESMPNLATGSDEFYTQVAREWERMMYRGENTSHGLELSGALAYGRRNPPFGSMVMFQSATSKVWSLFPRAASQAAKGNYRGAIRSVAGFVGSTVHSAWARTLIKVMRGKATAEVFDPRDEKARKEFLKTIVKEVAGYPPFIGSAMQAVARKAVGEGFLSFPTGTIEGMIADSARAGADLIGAAQDYFENEYGAEGEAWIPKLKRGLDGMAEVISQAKGIPYGGTKDLWNIIRTQYEAIKGKDPDIASALLAAEEDYSPADVGKAGHKLWAAVKSGDSALFREALLDRKEAGGKMKQSYITSSVRNRKQFKGIGKYESKMIAGIETNKERAKLSNEELELVDSLLAQRDQMIDMALDLARENRDLLTGFVGDGDDYLESLKSGRVPPLPSRSTSR